MKKIAIMQPYFFPYIGYFQLINAVDEFVVYDDVQFIKGGWINRNRILVNEEPSFINLNIKKDSTYKKINERYLVDNIDFFKKKLLKSIQNSYAKAPYFDYVFHLIQEIIKTNEKCISEFLINSFIEISKALDINTRFVRSSNLDIDSKENRLDKEKRIYRIMDLLEATFYINPLGGKELYFKSNFKDNGKELFFIKTEEIKYKQFSGTFVPNLSIIDVLMFNGFEKTKFLLDSYSLV